MLRTHRQVHLSVRLWLIDHTSSCTMQYALASSAGTMLHKARWLMLMNHVSYIMGLKVTTWRTLTPLLSLTDLLTGFGWIPKLVLGESGGCIPSLSHGYANGLSVGKEMSGDCLGASAVLCWGREQLPSPQTWALLPPKSLLIAAVCSSKTSKQLYRERFLEG